jgi:hypothetical protein
MKTRHKSSWNNLVDRLVATLDSSHRFQKQLVAETNAAATKEIRERFTLSSKAKTPRRGRPPKQWAEVPL